RGARGRGRAPADRCRPCLRPLRLAGVRGDVRPFPRKGRHQQLADKHGKAGNSALDTDGRHLLIRQQIAAAAKPGGDDADHVGSLEPARGKARCEPAEIVDGKGGLQFRQRAERQAENAPFTIDLGLDLAATAIGADAGAGHPHHSAPKLMAPADSSAISKVTSPLCAPAYSSAVTWNAPVTLPKSGMTICQER